MKKLSAIAASITLYCAPLVAGLRQPTTTGPTPTELVDQARRSGLGGWSLVACVATLIHDQFEVFSGRSPWEQPARALHYRRGNSTQINGLLRDVLRELGFDARLVFAARVRTDANPWFHMGHAWVRVVVDGRGKDVCAIYGTEPGNVDFVPVTAPRPWSTLTYVDTTVALCVLSAGAQWRARLTKQPIPRWLERDINSLIDQ